MSDEYKETNRWVTPKKPYSRDSTPTPLPTYHSGECCVVTVHAGHYDLWYQGNFVAPFSTFRAAVAYMMREFQV